mmetsp:Transcript_124254/g.362741  ORF Transcript_124254/g.362741 Transcript_124254/m.362741 type:complete len:299 (-) Transcript_124254:722-1618(-)
MVQEDRQDLVQPQRRHAPPGVRVPREVAQRAGRLDERLDVVGLQQERPEKPAEELLAVLLKEQVRRNVVEQQVCDCCHDVQHQLLAVSYAFRPQHVEQRVHDRAGGRQGGARRGADGDVGQQAHELHEDLLGLLHARAAALPPLPLLQAELALALPVAAQELRHQRGPLAVEGEDHAQALAALREVAQDEGQAQRQGRRLGAGAQRPRELPHVRVALRQGLAGGAVERELGEDARDVRQQLRVPREKRHQPRQGVQPLLQQELPVLRPREVPQRGGDLDEELGLLRAARELAGAHEAE